MANQVDAVGSRRHMRLLSGILVALSLVVVGLAESTHSHDDTADSLLACSICELTHKADPVVSTATPTVSGPRLVPAPALRGHRLNVRAVHLSPQRSRAPPLPISL